MKKEMDLSLSQVAMKVQLLDHLVEKLFGIIMQNQPDYVQEMVVETLNRYYDALDKVAADYPHPHHDKKSEAG